VNSGSVATWLPLAVVLLGIASLFYLMQTSELTSTGYNIQELQGEESYWRMRSEQLALEVASAKSLAVVEAEAAKRLGMLRAKESVYLQPTAPVLALRASPASRGEARPVPGLEKPAPDQSKGAVEVVQQFLASALAPRHHGIND